MAEKLTIVSPISVRFSETGLRELDGLAAIEGMERGEFIRHLVAQEKKRQHSIWLARMHCFPARFLTQQIPRLTRWHTNEQRKHHQTCESASVSVCAYG